MAEAQFPNAREGYVNRLILTCTVAGTVYSANIPGGTNQMKMLASADAEWAIDEDPAADSGTTLVVGGFMVQDVVETRTVDPEASTVRVRSTSAGATVKIEFS